MNVLQERASGVFGRELQLATVRAPVLRQAKGGFRHRRPINWPPTVEFAAVRSVTFPPELLGWANNTELLLCKNFVLVKVSII